MRIQSSIAILDELYSNEFNSAYLSDPKVTKIALVTEEHPNTFIYVDKRLLDTLAGRIKIAEIVWNTTQERLYEDSIEEHFVRSLFLELPFVEYDSQALFDLDQLPFVDLTLEDLLDEIFLEEF